MYNIKSVRKILCIYIYVCTWHIETRYTMRKFLTFDKVSFSLQFLTPCTKGDMHTPIYWTWVNKSKKFRQCGFTHGCWAVVTVTVSYYDSDKRTLMRGNRREKIRLERHHKKRRARRQGRAEWNIFCFSSFYCYYIDSCCVTAIVISSLCKWDMLSKAILDWRKW